MNRTTRYISLSVIFGLAFIARIQGQNLMTVNLNDSNSINFNTSIIDSVVWSKDSVYLEQHPMAQSHVGIRILDIMHDIDASTIDSVTWKQTNIGTPIDLGLSVRWSSINIGASNILDYGTYYSWGDIGYRNSYRWDNYKWFDINDTLLTKYNNDEDFGVVDDLYEIERNDDVAFLEWGEEWRTPTDEEMQELLYGCSWSFVKEGGVFGIIGQSKTNNNWIYLPATGYVQDSFIIGDTLTGFYWSSSLDSVDTFLSKVLAYNDERIVSIDMPRFYGMTVRPVSLYPPYEIIYDTVKIGPAPGPTPDPEPDPNPDENPDVDPDENPDVDPDENPDDNPDTHEKDPVNPQIREIPITDLKIKKDTVELYVGQTAILSTVVKSGKRKVRANIEWSTSDKSVAEVRGRGTVIAKNLGQCTISARCQGLTDHCIVKVVVSGVSIDQSGLIMTVGQNYRLKAVVKSGYRTLEEKVQWLSTDNSVAGVNNDGVVVANGIGDCYIIARYGDFCAYCAVKVRATEIIISEKSISLEEGERYQLEAIVKSGKTIINEPIEWTSSDNRVASVTEDGLVVAKTIDYGSDCYVTVSFGDLSARCQVTVTRPRFYLNIRYISTFRENKVKLQGYMTENNRSYSIDASDISFVSSDEHVASVNKEGLVSALSDGECVINCTYYDQSTNRNYYYTCEVHVGDLCVDLGLSVNWASKNIGAEGPKDFGNYYSWGETEPKQYYYWDEYKYSIKGYMFWYTKYDPYHNDGDKIALDPSDDVANVKWGDGWRMPEPEECLELNTYCSWTETDSLTDVYGYIITSRVPGYTGCSIFIPKAGYYWDAGLSYEFSGINYGSYWTRTLRSSGIINDEPQYYLLHYGIHSLGRYAGLPVRAVRPK